MQSGHNQTVEIPTVFKGSVIIDGNVVCLGLIGDVDLKFILDDAVISEPAQVRTGNKLTMSNDVLLPTNIVSYKVPIP